MHYPDLHSFWSQIQVSGRITSTKNITQDGKKSARTPNPTLLVNPLGNPQEPTLRSACFICWAWRNTTLHQTSGSTVGERFALACSLDAETDGAESWKFPSIHKKNTPWQLQYCIWKKVRYLCKHASISFGKMLLMAHEINYLINAWWLDRMFYDAVLHPEFRLQSLAGQIWHAMFLNRPESTDPSAACKIQNE